MLQKFVVIFFCTLISHCANADAVPTAQPEAIVTCHLSGQLGNQLFVTATTLAYAWDYNATPYFPDLNLKRDRLSYNRDRIFFRLNANKPPRTVIRKFAEKTWYSSDRIPFQRDLKLIGAFQSWKHFDHQRQKLLEIYAPSQADVDYLHAKYSDLISNPNTVAIHVRTFNKALHNCKAFPFLGLKYYEEAIKLFPSDSIFVVFSDRINWCKKHFEKLSGNFIFIEGNDGVQDLFLMSMMKNIITANSSFSWWAAYLNQNPDKIVVVPQQWKLPSAYATPFDNLEDFYLPQWVIIPNNLNEPYPKDMTAYDTSQSLDGN